MSRKRRRPPQRASTIPRPKPPAPVKATRPAILRSAEPTDAQLMGQAIVGDFTLIECPTWRADVVAGRREVDVIAEPPEFPHTHGGICQGCGRLVAESKLTGCPKMKNPDRAVLELMRLRAPPETLHAEA